MKLSLVQGTTSKLARVFIQDSTSASGNGLTGLTSSSSGLTAYYIVEGSGSTTAITLAAGTLGTWSNGGFVAVDGTNMPGLYEIGIPNAALTGGKSVVIMLKGAANMVPVLIELELTAINNQDAVRFGMSALPNGAMEIKKNQALANFQFLLVSSTDHVTPVSGLTVTSQHSIDGAAFASTTNSAASLSNGIYTINLSAADLNGQVITFLFSATGADSRYVTIITQP